MLALVVRFELDEGAGEQFDALTAEVLQGIKAKEPGTLVYATHTVEGEPLTRIFYEVYADRDAFQAHEDAEHVKDFHTRKSRLLRGQPRVEFMLAPIAKGLPTLP